eukprot:CAMPEP_0202816720 /NCGR_PEP_ID=MMETSP1389-20130828/7136_1 /ASSEMBLY_ACC=CAM_ASM_000865 /TAXON_ID=302021 /ORGANISM="Rhodomonas sp., Strain CCMP768" /LENGTH=87 /DNA_ID=CAMNT_0049488815 /DNA_START=37 /DNA_END=300 /DNA_ORIENTATION=-
MKSSLCCLSRLRACLQHLPDLVHSAMHAVEEAAAVPVVARNGGPEKLFAGGLGEGPIGNSVALWPHRPKPACLEGWRLECGSGEDDF